MDTIVREGELLWTPPAGFAEDSTVGRFIRWLARERRLEFADYAALWRWSVDDLEAFWAAVWDFFEVRSSTPYSSVLERRVMPGARWFSGARLNFAEHVLRNESRAPRTPALVHSSELRPLEHMSWSELGERTRALAGALRELGIQPGERVVAYMPNIPETAIAMLATTAIGAVWSAAAPEFGARTVIDRFAQIEPSVLFVTDGYRFGGKDFERSAQIAEILAALPSLRHIVWLPYLDRHASPPRAGALIWDSLLARGAAQARRPEAFAYERVPADHPLWILFSSGTTGLPKAIVHGHAGVTLELLKSAFAGDSGPDRRSFFFTTTGWMMWNALIGTLLHGGSVVLYDGHPAYPGPELLWQLAEDAGATGFGASPTFVQIMQKIGLVPKQRFATDKLRNVTLTGSPVSPETTAWFYRNVKEDLWVNSPSGGTELCAGLVGGSPLLPVYAGEIQTRLLGMDVHAWDERGRDVEDSVGELVVTSPAPSMPLRFWNDPDDRRYRETYFERFPGVWRHGDFLKINERGGCFIYGRSDSTLNRFGVRIGSAEIYRILERIPAVADSLVVCLERPAGEFFMPLFVKLTPSHVLDDALRAEIAGKLRNEGSPRHVPDTIVAVEAIPYTLTGKKMEIPVRRLLGGARASEVASRDAMMDPSALDIYVEYAAEYGAAIATGASAS
jgi:acetoacetyl-CoA synthetase